MVTIKDIARVSGFSPSTVSRALTGSKLIPPSSCEKIKHIADEMGYVPNLTAKKLQSGQSKNIGIISFIDNKLGFAHNLFSGIMDAFIREAIAREYDITIIPSLEFSNGIDLVSYCKIRDLSGVLVILGGLNHAEMQKLAKSDIPTVFIDGYDVDSDNKCYYVSGDNFQSMKNLTNKVLQAGHENIVYVHGENIYVTRERIKGFKSALEEHNVPFRDDMLYPGHYYSMDHVEGDLETLLSRKNPPSCILFPDDYNAMKAYDVLGGKGIRIGEDISIVGFDGLEYVKHIRPHLTTVMQDVGKMGKLAANVMFSVIDGQDIPKLQLAEGEIFEGESLMPIQK